jgi:hypothetical protein
MSDLAIVKPAREERNGWRDEAISRLHRQFGFDYPAVDIDFLLCEYDEGIPVAIIEHKCIGWKEQKKWHPSFSAVRSIADTARIPFWLCEYAADLSFFQLSRMNSIALSMCPKELRLTQDGYRKFLERLRAGSSFRAVESATPEQLKGSI